MSALTLTAPVKKPVTLFDLWMAKVDAWLDRTVEMNHRDLADCPWFTWYDDGVGPRTAARVAVKLNMGDDGC